MQFTDITFLFAFLPIALLVYHLGPPVLKKPLLLFFSLFFYACGSRGFFFVLCAAVCFDVCLGYMVAKRAQKKENSVQAKALVIAGIAVNIALLLGCKYNSSAVLPLGVSYFTFKAISFLADVYKGKADGTQPLTAASYLIFFGQIQAGPITRYDTFDKKPDFLQTGGAFRWDAPVLQSVFQKRFFWQMCSTA